MVCVHREIRYLSAGRILGVTADHYIASPADGRSIGNHKLVRQVRYESQLSLVYTPSVDFPVFSQGKTARTTLRMAHSRGPVILTFGLKSAAVKANDHIFRSDVSLRAPRRILTFSNGTQDSVKLFSCGTVQRIIKAGARPMAPMRRRSNVDARKVHGRSRTAVL